MPPEAPSKFADEPKSSPETALLLNRAPIRPLVLRISIASAVVAWIVPMVLAVWWRDQEFVVAIIVWPIVFATYLWIFRLIASIAFAVDKLSPFGRVLRVPILWGMNAATLLFPLVAVGLEILFILFTAFHK